MDLGNIRRATNAVPFRPFRLRLADQRSIFVPHPDFIAISTRMVIVIDPLDESIIWVEPLLIVSLDYPPGAVPVGPAGDSTNGPAGEGAGSQA